MKWLGQQSDFTFCIQKSSQLQHIKRKRIRVAMKQPWSRHVEDTSHNEHPVSTTKPVWTPLRPPFRPSTCINRHQHAVNKHGCGAPSSFSNANPKINCEDEQRCCPRFQSTSASGALRSATAGEPP